MTTATGTPKQTIASDPTAIPPMFTFFTPLITGWHSHFEG
jgi:hypothetical protein